MPEITLIHQIYRHAAQPVLAITDLSKALNNWYRAYPGYNYLHPCVIDGRAALVCQYDLSLIDPQAFLELQAISSRYQIFLKEDRRNQALGFGRQEKRKNKLVVLAFCMNLMLTSRLVSAEELQTHTTVTAYTRHENPTIQAVQSLGADGQAVLSLRHRSLPSAKQVLEAYAKNQVIDKSDAQAELKIKTWLQRFYQTQAGDPTYIESDLEAMAHYYAAYPEVVHLLESLQDKKLSLKFKADNWQTQAWGSPSTVSSVTIFFDTRIGATQLLDDAGCYANPACAITPADALLHEFLHAKLMLIDNQHFLESGGMQQSLYPFEHEREVINQENQLYVQMNQEDGLFRPIRHQHIGVLVNVGCALCLPKEMLAHN
jgi:hypothetical protein